MSIKILSIDGKPIELNRRQKSNLKMGLAIKMYAKRILGNTTSNRRIAKIKEVREMRLLGIDVAVPKLRLSWFWRLQNFFGGKANV